MPDGGSSGALEENAHWETHKGATSTAGKECSMVCRAVVLPQDQCVQNTLQTLHRHTRVGTHLQNPQLRLLFCLFTTTSQLQRHVANPATCINIGYTPMGASSL